VKVDYIKCLAVPGGICKMSGFGSLFGGTPYNPIVCWVAIACLVGGFILKRKG